MLNYINVLQLTLDKVIELRPTSYHSWPAFKGEFYGVTQGKYKALNYINIHQLTLGTVI